MYSAFGIWEWVGARIEGGGGGSGVRNTQFTEMVVLTKFYNVIQNKPKRSKTLLKAVKKC